MITHILKSQTVILPEGSRPAAIAIEDGCIAAILPFDDAQGEDVTPLVILPGLVDPHVHCNDPGRTDWESFPTATRAAAAGGVTTIVDMPLNSSPVTTSLGAFHQKLAAAQNNIHVDVGFHAGLVAGNAHELPALLAAGVLGLKAFLCHSGIDEFPAATEADLHAAMPLCAAANIPLLAHAELAENLPVTGDPSHYATYLASRPPQWEQAAIDLMIRLCRQHNCPTHIVHLAASEALPALIAARAAGLPLTVETCPHYLFFSAEEIPNGATHYKCAPPIRSRANQQKLWAAIKSHTIDLIASDHSPCPPAMKLPDTGNFLRAWGGISSLQLTLPIIHTAARAQGLTLADISHLLSTAPAKMMRLSHRKGRLAPGLDADLILFDPTETFTVDPQKLHHLHPLTPYAGRTLQGKIHRTLLRGQTIFDGKSPTPSPLGQPLLRTA